MRLDLPHEEPQLRSRRPEPQDSNRPVRVIEAGPLDRRMERLRETASHRRPLNLPRRTYERSLRPERERETQSRRVRRDRESQGISGLHLRDEEQKLLAEVGRFRVVAVSDLRDTVYAGNRRALQSDLRFLRERGLIALDQVNARRDGRSLRSEHIDVVTLTKEGKHLAYAAGDLSADQKLYHGLVKPREVEHDTEIYRAYRKEWQRIEQEGGTNPRVKLDFELKSEVQRAIYAKRQADPDRALEEIKGKVAEQFQLPLVNGRIEFPDARIEYDLARGGLTGSSDIEVATAAYRPAHLRGKAQAGFQIYMSGRDRERLGALIHDDTDLMERILDL